MTVFCEKCGCSILTSADVGRVERETVTVGPGGSGRQARPGYVCLGCVEEEERDFQAWLRSPEAAIEARFCRLHMPDPGAG